ncbi:hypothetical protein [Gracilibacillus salinarum]|uniref:Tetratricopeptide repeat protein n=1 Tax=Gracilibacillus salinarum TaxID=2932255 RepID=A0ABY4GHH0_9BACI|nr:hypothetical protein [Gracilibacillus salinarum]UOQ83664.1 hypothetical protein MUN87_12955 [Gracilibacillus salinarum]
MERLKWAKEGLKLLDEAVTASPEDSKIRLLRGKVAYTLPEKHFHRGTTAIGDFTYLINHSEDEEDFLPPYKYVEMSYQIGNVYNRIGRNEDARHCFQSLEKKTEDDDFRYLLRLRLKELAGKPAIEYTADSENPMTYLVKRTLRATEHELKRF